MPLNYYLAENQLTTTANDYLAKNANVRSFALNEIIDRMTRKGVTVTKTDIVAVLQAFQEEIADLIADGAAVNTPLFNAQPSISGTFDGPTDAFDTTRHKINVNLSAGLVLKEAIGKVRAEKVAAPASAHHVTAVVDKMTNITNARLTPNAPIEIIGTKIKLTNEASAGVFFVAEDGATHKATLTITNDPSKLVVMSPVLKSGTYSLEVRTFYSGGGKPLKDLRIARLDKVLTVL